MDRACSTNGQKVIVENIGSKTEEESPGRPRYRLVHNIEMDHREIGWSFMDWIDLVQVRNQWRALVNTAMNLQVP
jgi:hypothetical protein